MDTQLKDFTDEMTNIRDLIREVEKTCKPRSYVQNRTTKKTHRILAGFDQVGDKAITYCGWKDAKAPVRFLQGPPAVTVKADLVMICDACLPEVSAKFADA